MAYEVFERSAVRVEEPAISIGPPGKLLLNAAASRLMDRAGAKAVCMLWDKATYKVALKVAPKSDKNAFSISSSGPQSRSIRATSFFAHIGWAATERKTIPAIWNEKDRMIEAVIPVEYIDSERARELNKREARRRG